jgi:hypothetical protein
MLSRPLAPAAAALLLAACGTSPAAPRPCAAPTDCQAGSFCRSGRCAESTPPVAAIAASAGPLRSHSHLVFDGSGSRDADVGDGDQVVAWRWTAQAVSAPCEPVHPTGTGASYDLVAGCAGTFEVRLSVADTTGRASEPARALVLLEPSPTPPAATLAGPASLEHRCQGSPLRCTTIGPAGEVTFGLQATAEHPVTGGFTWAWSAVPPPGLPGPAPRVTFEPPDGPSPAVRIETDATAISGEYELKVVATDAEGLAAVAVHRLTVGNQPPVVLGGGDLLVGHAFDAAGGRFLASGAVQAQASDPDGDPLVSAGFSTVHQGAGNGTFDLVASGSSADFAIAVPYLSPGDALSLIGGPGLRRAIRYAVTDVNGAAAEAVWEVRVANRPPRLVATVDTATADHSFDGPSLSYRASTPVSSYLDDDGDPIVQRGPTGNADCPALDPVTGSGSPRLRCRRVYTGVPEAHLFAITQAVTLVLGDPFESIDPRPFAFTIGNRLPRITAGIPVVTTCAQSSPPVCCRAGPPPERICLDEAFDAGPGSIVVPPPVVDDDGDPVRISFEAGASAAANPSAMTCTPSTCPNVTLSVEAVTAACVGPRVEAVVSDGGPPSRGAVGLGVCF